jgi:hypothetical protein
MLLLDDLLDCLAQVPVLSLLRLRSGKEVRYDRLEERYILDCKLGQVAVLDCSEHEYLLFFISRSAL